MNSLFLAIENNLAQILSLILLLATNTGMYLMGVRSNIIYGMITIIVSLTLSFLGLLSFGMVIFIIIATIILNLLFFSMGNSQDGGI